MNSIEPRETWPVIGQSDVPDLCRAICGAVVELERAFEVGKLASRLTSGSLEKAVGPQLFETYAKLASSAPGPQHYLRLDAVSALLAQLQNDLSPNQIAHARVSELSERDASITEPEVGHRTSRLKLVDASFKHEEKSTTLRIDQMLDARFWRIGFTFEERNLGDEFSRLLVRSSIRRLVSDLLGLQRILERFSEETPTQGLKIIPYPGQRRFEHLIQDILNEEARHARLAPLLEDFLEKTDIRVQYPELERRNGARVQITSITTPEQHKSKIQKIRLVEEFVFLSPLSMAEFVASLRDHGAVTEKSGRSRFALTELWNCLEIKPADVPQLASELKRILLRALKKTSDSPLGPIMRVPLPIRQLIRLFVETRAIASTKRLRNRERELHAPVTVSAPLPDG